MNKQRRVLITTTYNEMGIIIDTKAEEVSNNSPELDKENGELIRRQAAIDAHCELCGDRGKCNCDICPDIEVFQLLPPAQQAAGDTISRCELFNRLANVQTIADAYAVIQGMPASQQEIIRCKECVHWLPHCQLGFDIDNEEYHDYCGKLIPDDEYYAFYRNADDYCSRAERKSDE